MSFLERSRTRINSGLDQMHVWLIAREGVFTWAFRRLLQSPELRAAKPRKTFPPLEDRSPEEAFRDRQFAAAYCLLVVSLIVLSSEIIALFLLTLRNRS